jgi:hypothetical protein
MKIEPLSPAVRDYLHAFELTAIAVSAEGHIRMMRDPVGASAEWCEAGKAGAMLRAARQRGGDISAAACSLGVALTDHATALARAKFAVARIEAGIAWAQRSGVLHEFNQEFRRRRLEAQGRGEQFMGYAQATARLRRAIAKVASGVPASIVREVFENGGRRFA